MTAGADYALQSGTAGLKINNGFHIALSHFYARNVYMEHYNLSTAADEPMTAEQLLHNDSAFRGPKYSARPAQLRRYPSAKGRQHTIPRHHAEQDRPFWKRQAMQLSWH